MSTHTAEPGEHPSGVAGTGAAPGSNHRDRLIAAMAELLAEQGYATLTVTDVVARARVSKRTFYQHFADREECLLATYRVVAEAPLQRIAEAAASMLGTGMPAHEEIAGLTGSYLAAMAEHPLLTRAMLTEVGSAGPAGLAVRRQVLRSFADGLVALAAADGRELRDGMAQALVGGINELVLSVVESPGVPAPQMAEAILALGDTVTEFGVAVLGRL